ncbi:MAG TPA: type II toxin-antitoxin system VapC family toxin [Rubrivivax sp.]|nr:type II toxin-antitoxin system VapC family toxin [Rubrivivax sp.]
MTRVVVDASVVLKWFLGARPGGDDVDSALTLLSAVAAKAIELVQPPHFIAEVAAVLIRETPSTAHRDIADLLEMDMRVVARPDDYALAMTLAHRYQLHVFDTLYHALALHTQDAAFVTADERFERRARAEGRVLLLRSAQFTQFRYMPR